jgi:cyanate permease
MSSVATRKTAGRLAPPATRAVSYRWVLVTSLGMTSAISYGVLSYAFGALLPFMRADLGWSTITLTSAYSLATLVSGVSAVFVGRLLDRRSPRLPMAGGSLLAGLMVLAWSRVESPIELLAVFAGLGVAMSLVLYEPAFVVVTQWFGDRRHEALALLTTIAAFSSLVFAPLAVGLALAWGWRGGVCGLGCILLATTVPVHVAVLRPGASHRVGEMSPHRSLAGDYSRGRAVRSRSFWAVVACFSLASFATSAMVVHLVPLLVARGSSASFAALAVGIMGVSQIAGRLAFPVLSHILSPAAGTALVFVAAGGSLVILLTGRSVGAILVSVVVYGACSGALTLLRATVPAALFGRPNYGSIAGVQSAFVLSACAAAPIVGAVVSTLDGGYDLLLAALVAVTAAAGTAGVLGMRAGGG